MTPDFVQQLIKNTATAHEEQTRLLARIRQLEEQLAAKPPGADSWRERTYLELKEVATKTVGEDVRREQAEYIARIEKENGRLLRDLNRLEVKYLKTETKRVNHYRKLRRVQRAYRDLARYVAKTRRTLRTKVRPAA